MHTLRSIAISMLRSAISICLFLSRLLKLLFQLLILFTDDLAYFQISDPVSG